MDKYIKYKVIRYPVTSDMLDSLGYKFWEIPNLSPSLFNTNNSKYLMLSPTYARYLDLVVSKQNDKKCQEYGRIRPLLDSEKERFKDYFSEFFYDADMNNARVIEYSYCEGTVPPDYYHTEDNDDFYNEIN